MKFIRFIALMLAVVFMTSSCGGQTDGKNSSANETTAEQTENKNPVTGHISETEESPDEIPEDSSSVQNVPETPEESIVETTEDSVDETPTESISETTPETTPVTERPTVTVPVTVDPSPVKYTPRAMMYHLIREDVYGIYDALFVRPSEFESHLILLNELGYEYIFADEWRLTDRPSVILTLDDGYLDNYTNMFPLLKKYGAKATVFIVTNLIGTDGYMTRDMIAEMAASGLVSFQCHTVNHVDLRYQDEAGLRAEFGECARIIEEITGRPVKALAYPAGGYNSTVIDIASEYFDFAYTTKSPYYVKEYSTYEVPRYYVARGEGRNQFYNKLR